MFKTTCIVLKLTSLVLKMIGNIFSISLNYKKNKLNKNETSYFHCFLIRDNHVLRIKNIICLKPI